MRANLLRTWSTPLGSCVPHSRSSKRACILKRLKRQADKEDATSFDSLQLDKEYYEEVGITPDQAAEDLDMLWNIDPEVEEQLEGQNYLREAWDTENHTSESNEELEPSARGSSARQESDIASATPYGPSAIILAGFRDHELGMVRASVDRVGGFNIKVLPCSKELLYGTVSSALCAEEPVWERPREGSVWNNAWGSQRVILFSGLTEEEILTILDILEGDGLPTLIAAVASAENSHRLLGEVLAEALKAQRHWKPKDIFQESMVMNSPAATAKSPARLSRRSAAASSPVESESGVGQRPVQEAASPASPSGPLQEGSRWRQKAKNSMQDASPILLNPKGSSPKSSFLETEGLAQGSAAVGLVRGDVDKAMAGHSLADPEAQPLSSDLPESSSGASDHSLQIPPDGRQDTSPIASTEDKQDRGDWKASNKEVELGRTQSDTELEDIDASTGLASFAKIESSSFASEQRALREEAAREVTRRAELSQSADPSSYMQANNMIDAVASGEDLSAVLGPGLPALDSETAQTARRAEARQKLEAMLEEMRQKATDLPEDKRKKYAADLKQLENNQDSISQVLSELGQDLDSIPKHDRNAVKQQLRDEAWQPTKDAIGAALACGVSGDEIRAFLAEAERAQAAGEGGWYPSVVTPQK